MNINLRISPGNGANRPAYLNIFGKRPVRSRMQGVVEAGGEKPPAIRLGILPLIVGKPAHQLEYSREHYIFIKWGNY